MHADPGRASAPVDTIVSGVESALFSLREISRRLNVPIKTLARIANDLPIRPDFESTNAKLYRPSRLAEIRRKIEASKSAQEKVHLARQAKELRGTMFELAATLPDLESVRKRIEQSTAPREKAILARYARGLRGKPINQKKENQ